MSHDQPRPATDQPRPTSVFRTSASPEPAVCLPEILPSFEVPHVVASIKHASRVEPSSYLISRPEEIPYSSLSLLGYCGGAIPSTPSASDIVGFVERQPLDCAHSEAKQ